jgi:hypothetical protein
MNCGLGQILLVAAFVNDRSNVIECGACSEHGASREFEIYSPFFKRKVLYFICRDDPQRLPLFQAEELKKRLPSSAHDEFYKNMEYRSATEKKVYKASMILYAVELEQYLGRKMYDASDPISWTPNNMFFLSEVRQHTQTHTYALIMNHAMDTWPQRYLFFPGRVFRL